MKPFLTPAVRFFLTLTTAVFLVQLAAAGSLLPASVGRAMVGQGAMIGAQVWDGQYARLVTSLFLHGGLTHFLFNMLALVSFGHVVERAYGAACFVFIYLLGGVAANLLFGLTSPHSACIGASGAVAAVLMVSALKFPSQVVIVGLIPLPIRIFAALYVIVEAVYAFGSDSQIAHIAHLGGLAFGYGWFKVCDGKAAKRPPG